MAIGIDEVGRGAWAGPLLIIAARQCAPLPVGLKDSKMLSKTRREKFMAALHASCEFGEGWVTAAEIDRLGLVGAMFLGTKRALENLEAQKTETIIFDGNYNFCDDSFIRASAVIKADVIFPIVSAASIYAKVTRDTYMATLPPRYSSYDFETHVGYGTKAHLRHIEAHGITDLHRRSFAPIKELL
jgi:ribonuclease HII